MQLRKIIGDRIFFLGPEIVDRDHALQILTDGLVAKGAIRDFQRDRVMLGVLKREATAPTAVGGGVAIPHAKLNCIHAIVAALGLSPLGIDFGTSDGSPVRVVFLLLSPESSEKEHLELVGMLGQILQKPAFVDRIVKAESVVEAQAVLERLEELLRET
ncbi:MAG: PTS sugar transporter subunit IIA [Planctomycetes bacterium]|nr:PTS sugar transporter subunit IIA [Planctomycetota bacterium]